MCIRDSSRTLKYLERMGIVEREVVDTRPFSVVYHLTEKGRDMADILAAYRIWGEKWTVPPVQAMKTVSQAILPGAARFQEDIRPGP